MSVGREILKLIQKENLDICDDWKEKIKRSNSIAFLCSLYFKGDDWSLENDFPRIEFLRSKKSEAKNFGMMIDISEKFLNLQKGAFFGFSRSHLVYDGFQLGKIIVRHQTKLKIEAKDNSIVYLTCLDDVELDIEIGEKATVTVFAYSENVKINFKGKIHIIKKNEFSSLQP